MLSSGVVMHGEDDMVDVKLRPLLPGEALHGFERDDAEPGESDSQRPQLRYAPSDPRGVVLIGNRRDRRARLGFGLLRPVEGAHALVEGELCVGVTDPRRRAALQERLLDALIRLARREGSRRLRLRMRVDELANGPWARRLLVTPSVRVSHGMATVEFPLAAYYARRNGSRSGGSSPARGVSSAA